ncbi:hypothetical protein [Janthinobacterium sp. BJB304]|uniref:hypothetical protein n=1 Tax=Janthinobacterium sp. BJB304 TaxID=1572871 RepID=UPI000C0F7DAE|nr:hypothetical protein [Janthinobacterium sp. BJB304]PHV35903.1 hypothetical protein CSQ95_27390 [Janthinobacterium sp. BJB304]
METKCTSKATDPVRFQLVELSRRTSLDIDSDAFDDARRDYLFNQAALATEEKYALVLQNYVQFESTLHAIALNHLVFSAHKWSDFVDGIQLVNGSLLNLLSSTKAYLDQVPQHLNDVFGNGSAQATAFEQLTNKEFDERFEYRVISGLRNHLQHGDFPVKWLNFSSDWKTTEGEKESCAHKIAAFLSIDDLLKNDKIRALTRDELKALGQPRLDVKPLVRAYVSSIARLHCSVRSSIQQKTHPAEERVRDLITRARDSAMEMPLGLSAVAFSEIGQVLEQIPVFSDNIDRRKHLQKRSSVITNLEKHFVSAEAIPT